MPVFSLAADGPVPAGAVEMSLGETIALALRSNRAVKSAYMDRAVQKLALEVAYDEFRPDVSLTLAPSFSGRKSETSDSTGAVHTRSDTALVRSGLKVAQKLKTGANLTFSWARTDMDSDKGSDAGTWTASFVQPLLKGAGMAVNTASLTLADLTEQSNLLGLKERVAATVGAVINAFRGYAQALRQLDISRASVKRAKELLETNRFLIAMGRMPANEVIQAEADVANREFYYETALNNLESARLNLLKVLDVDRAFLITPLAEGQPAQIHPDIDTCLETALANRSDFQNAVMAVERARLTLLQARNNRLWRLDLEGAYTVTESNQYPGTDSDTDDWRLGFSLSVPLYGDLTRKQAVLVARTGLEKARLALEETRQNIGIEVRDAVEEVETRLKQVGMAKRARELSEQKLRVEKEKLKVGRSTNFQLVTFQNDLVSALNEELNAETAFRNALTTLDRVVGTTLETWRIDYRKEYDQWPGK